MLQGPALGYTSRSELFEPNTAIRAPAPPTAAAHSREGWAIGRSLRTGSTHGAVRGLSDGRGWGLRQRWDRSWRGEGGWECMRAGRLECQDGIVGA